MEENNDIFLTGGDALVYLAEPMHKKFSTKFVWRYPFSTYLSYDRSFNLRPLYAPVHIFDDPPPFHSPVVYLIDGLFLNQKTNNNIRISYSLNYKHSKKEYILYENIRLLLLSLLSIFTLMALL